MKTILQQLSQLPALFSQIAPTGGPLPDALSAAGGLLLHVVTAVLALLIVLRCAFSLLRGRVDEENWGFFSLPNGAKLPLNHWENIIGRASS